MELLQKLRKTYREYAELSEPLLPESSYFSNMLLLRGILFCDAMCEYILEKNEQKEGLPQGAPADFSKRMTIADIRRKCVPLLPGKVQSALREILSMRNVTAHHNPNLSEEDLLYFISRIDICAEWLGEELKRDFPAKEAVGNDLLLILDSVLESQD